MIPIVLSEDIEVVDRAREILHILLALFQIKQVESSLLLAKTQHIDDFLF